MEQEGEVVLCLRVRNGRDSHRGRLPCGNSWLACARSGWVWLLAFCGSFMMAGHCPLSVVLRIIVVLHIYGCNDIPDVTLSV